MLDVPSLEKPANLTLSAEEWNKVLLQGAVHRLLDQVYGLLHYLRGCRFVDAVDWTEINDDKATKRPRTARGRARLALRNYKWLFVTVYEIRTELQQAIDGMEWPAATDILAILDAIDYELRPEVALAEFESYSTPLVAISRMKANIRHARRFAGVLLPVAVARARNEFGVPLRAEYSAHIPRKQWLAIFKLAGNAISEDTFDRRTKPHTGEYRRHPASARGKISLDLTTLPPEVAAQYRSYTAAGNL